MIKIVMEGMCEGCKYAELSTDYLVNGKGEKVWGIRCVNEFLCQDWQNRLQKEEGEQNDKID